MLHVLRVEMVINSPWLLSKNWLVQKQMALGKDSLNPFMADNLPKIIWFSSHHITCMKSWLVQKQTALGQTATSKESSNPFMAGVNTPRSDEDRLELMELMVFMMQKRDLISQEEIADDVAQPTSPLPPSPVIPPSPPHQSPRTSPSQAVKGTSILVHQVLDKCYALVLRVEGLESANTAQQLERLNKVKSSKLKHLQKVDTSQRIESLEDEENVFNQGRISVDIDEGIELVDDQEKDAQVKGRQADTQAKIYNIDLDHTSKVLSLQEDSKVQEVVEVVNAAKLMTEVVLAATTQVVHAAKPAVVSISVAKPAAKPKVLKIVLTAPAISTRKRKGVVIKDPEEELHDDTPAETLSDKGKGKGILVEDPKPIKKKDQIAMDAEFDDNMRFLLKSKEEMEKEEEEIIKSINETPAQKEAKRRRLREQAKDLKKQLETDAQDVIWRSQQTEHGQALVKSWTLLTSCGVHIITFTTIMFVLLVEKKYPLSMFTLEQLVNMARLQVEEESEMSLELLRFTRQQLLEYQQE
nr:hypothetical protein [Tanacetum cinerariifolium]